MGEEKGSILPPNVVNYIRGGRIVVVATTDAQGRPNSAPFSWVVAADQQRVRLAVSHGVPTLANIRRGGYASLTITGPDLHYTLRGGARVIKELLPDVPFPLAAVEVTVEEVKDDSLIGPTEEAGARTHWAERRQAVSDSTVIQALLEA